MKRLLLILLSCSIAVISTAQITDREGNLIDPENGTITDGTSRYTWGRDTTRTQKIDVPEGFFQWTIDERLGERISQDNDTVMAGFYRTNATDGIYGTYTHLGNLGSPRLAIKFIDRPNTSDPYTIQQSYDFLRPSLSKFRFWNTKSPITFLSYHSAGSSQTGEDHLRANFATNINKRSGVGFLIDYSYGRGYYPNQGNSLFNGSVYGYYLGDKYQFHAWISANHFKTTENGGIEDDAYISNPESFDRDFTSEEIPTNLSRIWNRNDDQTYYLSHRYNMGYYRDLEMPDSINVDSLIANDSTFVFPQEYIPVASIIHTFQMRHLRHVHYGEYEPQNYYADNLFGTIGSSYDEQYNTNIRNTLGLSLREGFRPWVKAGLTAFITHDYNQYKIPTTPIIDGTHPLDKYIENDISIGGTFARTGGHTLHFNVNGDIVVIGANVGQFKVDGNADLAFPLLKDTCRLNLHAYIKNLSPNFYWRHWHSQHAWWDKNLDKEFRTRIEGTFNIERTKTSFSMAWENVVNYTYLQTILLPTDANNTDATKASLFSHQYDIAQSDNAVQVLSATLNQNFKLGILHWDNEITWQKSSNERILALPMLSVFTNLYIHFKLMKKLRIDLGANMRYWTKYYAYDYAPTLNQYTAQDDTYRVKVGNHPIIDVYVNAQLKRLRFYVSANHVNAGSHSGFYAPHYPINPMNIHFGLSWNFVN